MSCQQRAKTTTSTCFRDFTFASKTKKNGWKKNVCFQKIGVTPKILLFDRVFHYTPSILGCFPLCWETPKFMRFVHVRYPSHQPPVGSPRWRSHRRWRRSRGPRDHHLRSRRVQRWQPWEFPRFLHSKRSPTGPTERTPKPEYPIAVATYLGVRW